jgi:hypothetical protein
MSPPDAMVALTAIYGAVVGTLGYRAQQPRRRRREPREETQPNLRMHVRHKVAAGQGIAFGDELPRLDYRIVVDVLNPGRIDVAVERVDLESGDGRWIVESHRLSADQLLLARRRIEREFSARSVLEYGQAFRAVVTLASGATLRSDLQELEPGLLRQTGLRRDAA